MKKIHGNASSLHTAGRRARGVIDSARRSVAALLSCDPAQLVFTSGGTEGNNAVIKGVFEAAGPGHLITTKIEHESVLGACAQVEKRGGELTYLPAGADGLVSAEDVKAAIRPDTILISVMHANNETGAIQPVEEIGRIARGAGIPFHTDAVQSFGKLGVKVDDIGCEFLTLSAHKINGPKGAGVLFCRGNTEWAPLVFGGQQERELRAGTEGVHQIAGLDAAVGLASERMDAELTRLGELRTRLIEGLRRSHPDARVNEAPPGRRLPGTVSVTFTGMSGLHVMAWLDCYEVSVSLGSACTADRIEPSHVLLGMGRSEGEALSTVRISMGTTTTGRDVDYLLKLLRVLPEKEPDGFEYLDPKHLTRERILSDDTMIVDLRYPYERMFSPSVPGAALWTYIGFDRYIRRIPRDKEVILMCGTGIFSASAGYRLANAGHPRARAVYGGYAAWQALYPNAVEELKRE